MKQHTDLPDEIEMLALKGFFAIVDGKYRAVQKGEVVTISKGVAAEVRMTHKAVMATEENRKTHAELIQEFERGKKPKVAPVGK